jgi:hypothetical protein
MEVNRQRIGSFFKSSTKPSQSSSGDSWFTPGWMMTLSVVQIVATLVFVSLFFITDDLQQISTCVLYLKNFGYAQYDLVSLGLLISGPIYQCILCLEALFQRRTSCLYATLAFELWLAIYSGVQAYQHPAIIKHAATCQFNRSPMNETITATASTSTFAVEPISYSIVGVTCGSLILFLFFAIYFRTSFQQSMDPVHDALISLLKLDFYLVFAYAIQLLPVPMIMTSMDNNNNEDTAAAMVGVAEIILVLGVSCVVFLLAWCMVLVTWRPLPWWRIMMHMIGLAVLCLTGITYLCYRLVRFALDSRTLAIRYALVFTSVYLIIALLLTMSIVTTCAVQQWQTRKLLRHHQQQQQQQVDVGRSQLLVEKDDGNDKLQQKSVDDEKNEKKVQLGGGHGDNATSLAHGNEYNDDDDDDIGLFLTPRTSCIHHPL